mgnify:CR=1 FL=1
MRNELYRCRVCGKVLTERLDDKRKPRRFSDWSFDNFFEEKSDRITYGYPAEWSSLRNTLLHRCNAKTIGMCDFIGIKKD